MTTSWKNRWTNNTNNKILCALKWKVFAFFFFGQQRKKRRMKPEWEEGWKKAHKLNFYWICGTKFMLCNTKQMKKKRKKNGESHILWKILDVTQRDLMKTKWFTLSVDVYCQFFFWFQHVIFVVSFNNDSERELAWSGTLFWFWFYIHFEWESCRNQWNGIIRPGHSFI